MSAAKTAVDAPPSTRRQEIVQTAAELFATQGFDRTTLGDIAAAQGVAKASIYHYFTSKDQLLSTVLEQGMTDMLSEAGRIQREVDDPIEALRQLLRSHVANFGEKLPHLTVYLHEGGHLESHPELVHDYLERRRVYDHIFVDVLERAQANGQIVEGDPLLMAYGILGMFNWMVQWYREDGRTTLSNIATQFEEMAVRSVLASPGPANDGKVPHDDR